ncbi:MAG TPA: TonB-dependent heme/hemoglobin receptor family protein, partial [Agrobacterium sp.]|nr:TonB-dependent heme/hemoglobin receptor family protein [Agrobacterium sp.]
MRLAAFCASLACSVSFYAHTQAHAQELRQFSIPAGPLDVALTRFGAASGIQILYDASLTKGLKTSGAAGALQLRDALGKLLDGTGLSFRFTAPDRVTVSNASQAQEATSADGSLVLETITVTGKSGRYGSPDAPYGTDAPTAYISGEDIDRFRGSSPADMFRGTAGVMSGEARNGAGAIDVNIC